MKLILPLIALVLSSVAGAEARSLWTEDSKFNFLITDANASRVGDLVTIIIEEDNRANDTAESESERTHDMNGVLAMLWNNPFMDSLFNGPQNAPGFQWNSSNEFEGESEVDRSNQFTSRIQATVVKIDPVGNLLLEARKTIKISEENKTIVLSGKVRPRDVVNNTVFSWQVADAEISYLGDGTLSQYNNPSILTRLFNILF